tara:strand:- start:431 stop:622 length:192 start_codon:yes stop_codon:yes gene_type:complete
MSGNQGDRFRKRDREYARSMGRDPSDTFDAEILPGGKRLQLQPCVIRFTHDDTWDCPECGGPF